MSPQVTLRKGYSKLIELPVTDQELKDLSDWASEHHELLVNLLRQVVLDAVAR